MSTAAEYTTRILSYVQGRDAIAVQRETPQLLAQLIQGVPGAKLQKRPEPTKWSVAELLAHLAEAEVSAFWRYRQMIEHDGGPLSSYNQELWNELGRYASRSPAESECR